MVEEYKKRLNKLASELGNLSESTAEHSEDNKFSQKRDVILFFSFDIVNSTEYKTLNHVGWVKIINKIFGALRSSVEKDISGAEIWRILGDEAVFIIKVWDEDTLQRYVNKIYTILINTIYGIKSGKLLESVNANEFCNLLSLKAAAWIAAVSNIETQNPEASLLCEFDNIFERYKTTPGLVGYNMFEFLGNDIDAGFRISKRTLAGRFVLSYELAYIISRRTESLSYLNIITYEQLKGIWRGALYPIIWYHDPRAYLDCYNKEIKFEDSFSYDAYDSEELIKHYFDNHLEGQRGAIRDSKMFTDIHYALEKIKFDRGLDKKIEYIFNAMHDSTHNQKVFIDSELMQVHCAAVCFKYDQGKVKILVFKRSPERAKFGGKWEFGCAKAVISESIKNRLIKEYKEDFKIDIAPVCDSGRDSDEPIPIALYSVNHEATSISNAKTDKGIIVLAEIVGEYDVNKFEKTQKHDEAKWISDIDIEAINDKLDDAVPDFKATIKRASEMIHSIKEVK